MAFTRLATALLFAGLLPRVLAQDNDVEPKFNYPNQDDGRLKFYDNTEVVVGFECPKETVDLRLFCRNEDDNKKVEEIALFKNVSCADEEYAFRVDFDYYAVYCWLNMEDNDGSGDIGLNSAGFELSRTPAEATFGLDRPTTVSTITSSIPSPTESSNESSTADSNTDSSSSDGSGGLSTGAKAGIGVGVSLGVLGIVALAVAFWMVRRKRRSGVSDGNVNDEDWSGKPQELGAGDGGYPPAFDQQKYQLDDDQGVKSAKDGPPSELADTARIHHELP